MANSAEINAEWRRLGRQLADLRRAADYSQHRFAPLVLYGRSSIANVETGHQQPDRSFWTTCDEVLATGGLLAREYDRIISLALAQRRQHSAAPPRSRHDDPPTTHNAALADERHVRERVETSLGRSKVTGDRLDDWEQTIMVHGRATRCRPARDLLPDLLADIDELRTLFDDRHSVMTLRRTTVLHAQLAGLISLTLIKGNAHQAARRWGRTARAAAADAGAPDVSAWVWAQEAYRYFYAGDIAEAIRTAQYARAQAGTRGGVGAALASALEARAHAATGSPQQVRRVLGIAEELLGQLPATDTDPSAFGYDQAQLRFHAGNAYTYLHDTETAWPEQQRALTLYPASDYLDRALTGLDRAACLLHDGDLRQGAQQIIEVVDAVLPADRAGLILARAQDVIDRASTGHQPREALREATEFLVLCGGMQKSKP